MSTTRAVRPLPLLLVAGLLVGCADGDPTAPEDPATLAAPEVAYAQGPDVSGVISDITYEGQLCGIGVVVNRRATGANFGNVFGQPARATGRVWYTFTNPENGNSFTFQGAGLVVRELLDQGVNDQGEPWIVVQQTDLGLRGKISSGGGVPRALSAGKGVVVIRVTFIAGGSPVVELLDVPFKAGPDDPASMFGSPEQCAIVEDILL